MNIKTMVFGCLAGMIVLAMGSPDGGNRDSQAQTKVNGQGLKIGVVSIQRVLRNCKATVKYREKAIAENDKMDIEEERLSREIQALAASLRAFKPGSSDHLARYQELLQKQSYLKTLREFDSRRRVLKDLQWTQDIYKEILRITKELAAEKGLDLVLGADEPEFPIQRYEQLVMTLSTHKVLYSDGCVDLTNEVVARLDNMEDRL